VIGWMLDQAVDWLLGSVRTTLDAVWKLLAVTLFHLPDVSGLPQVATVSARSLVVVNACYGLAIIAAGVAVMTHGSVQIRYGIGDLLPRLVIGLVAANLAPGICRAITSTSNDLVLALTGQGIASDTSFLQLHRVIDDGLGNPVSALLVAVIGLTICVLMVMLVAGWIARFVFFIVLNAIAPLALACHGTPWSDGIARLWWRSIGGLAATVLLQALALNISLSIFLDPAANLRSYGLPADPSGTLNLFFIACLLWMTVRIPGLVRRHLTQAGGRQNVLATIVRLAVVQQLTRTLAPAAARARFLPGVGRLGPRGPGAGRGPGRGSGPGPAPGPRGPRGPGGSGGSGRPARGPVAPATASRGQGTPTARADASAPARSASLALTPPGRPRLSPAPRLTPPVAAGPARATSAAPRRWTGPAPGGGAGTTPTPPRSTPPPRRTR
jgi:hypothetical protein